MRSAGQYAGGMTETINPEDSVAGDNEALLSRLQLIEERPLSERAEVFTQLHEELRLELEGSDSSA